MWKNKKVILIVIIFFIIIGFYIYQKFNTNIVIDPKSGQSVIKNELTILASGQDINSLVTPYKGKIVLKIKETDTYQVRFPVTDLSELNLIKIELNKKGVISTYSIVIEP